MTNISCILLEERHFGFYLHGRSAHDHADADMAQLNANLKLEVLTTALFEWKPSSALHARAHPGALASPQAESLVTTRGFTPDSNVQTYVSMRSTLSRRVPPCMHVLTTAPSLPHRYEIYLSRRMREKYDAAFAGVLYAEPTRRPLPGRRNVRTTKGPVSVRTKGFRAAPDEGLKRQRELNRCSP